MSALNVRQVVKSELIEKKTPNFPQNIALDKAKEKVMGTYKGFQLSTHVFRYFGLLYRNLSLILFSPVSLKWDSLWVVVGFCQVI